MSAKECVVCGRAARYLRPETGYTCKGRRAALHNQEKERQAESRLPTQKSCPRCERVLTADEFGLRRRKNRGGTVSIVLHTWCIECRREDSRHRMRSVPRAVKAARVKRYKYQTPSYMLPYARTASGRRRWERAASQMGSVTKAHLDREMSAHNCSYCLEPLTDDNRELDHVVPLCSGGEHDDANIVAACSSCNRSKGRKSLVQWLILLQAAGGRASGSLQHPTPPGVVQAATTHYL